MEKRGYFYISVAILSFSTLEIVGKLLAYSINPFQLVFLRFFLSSIIFLPFALKEIRRRKIFFSVKDISYISFLGILVVVIASSFYQLSLIYTKASIVAVIISANPIFVAPLAFFILGERADKSVIISLLLGMVGLLIISSPYFTIDSKNLLGIFFVLANAICFAAYNVFSKRYLPRFGSLILTCFAFFFGSITLLFILLASGISPIAGINSSNIFHLIYITVIGTAVPYLFMFKGLSLIPANRGSMIFFLKPPIAGMLAYIILGEKFTLTHLTGTFFIMTGLVFIISASNSNVKRQLKA